MRTEYSAKESFSKGKTIHLPDVTYEAAKAFCMTTGRCMSRWVSRLIIEAAERAAAESGGGPESDPNDFEALLSRYGSCVRELPQETRNRRGRYLVMDHPI